MVSSIEQLGSGVTRRWDETLNCMVFILPDTQRETVDAYIEGNLETLRNWDTTKPLYTIQDISNKNVSLTPYLRGRLSEITEYIKAHKIQVRTAIVMENDFTGQVMRAFGRLFTINARYLTQVYFTSFESASRWVANHQKIAVS